MVDAEKHKNNPVLQFALDMLEFNELHDCEKWVVTTAQMSKEYQEYCKSNSILVRSIVVFNMCLESMTSCKKKHVGINVVSRTTTKSRRTTVWCWRGCRIKGTSGYLQNKTED